MCLSSTFNVNVPSFHVKDLFSFTAHTEMGPTVYAITMTVVSLFLQVFFFCPTKDNLQQCQNVNCCNNSYFEVLLK